VQRRVGGQRQQRPHRRLRKNRQPCPAPDHTRRRAGGDVPSADPDRLAQVLADAFARVQLPLHLNWSAPERVFDLGSRADRARVYEVVLQEGRPVDVLAYVDGALLVDLWEDMVLPRAIRSAWAPVINASRGMAA
jgi:hypothetical protein